MLYRTAQKNGKAFYGEKTVLGYSTITSCETIVFITVPCSIFGLLPFIRPRRSPIGKNTTDRAITPPRRPLPFLQELNRSDTCLLSMVFVVAFVIHTLPALPHEFIIFKGILDLGLNTCTN